MIKLPPPFIKDRIFGSYLCNNIPATKNGKSRQTILQFSHTILGKSPHINQKANITPIHHPDFFMSICILFSATTTENITNSGNTYHMQPIVLPSHPGAMNIFRNVPAEKSLVACENPEKAYLIPHNIILYPKPSKVLGVS